MEKKKTVSSGRTMTATNIDLTELKSGCDEACKLLLSDKEIIARILKSTVKEFKGLGIADIRDICIEGEPKIAEVPVDPDETNARIKGDNNESTIYGEGTYTFDILFHVMYPKENRVTETVGIRMIMDLEAQNRYRPGYPIPTRGIYYGSRMISSQYNREFTGNHYEQIKKVYSIWICTNPVKEDKNTVTTYKIMKEDNIGKSRDEPEIYDLLSVIMICLGGEEYENYNGIIKMLDVLLSTKKKAEEKKQILEKEFDIPMKKELRKEVDDMCNYSEYVWEQGVEHGIESGIKAFVKLCREVGLSELETASKIMENFQMSGEEAEEIVQEYWGILGITQV